MVRLRPSIHKLDTIFISVLLILFAITAFVLVLIGVKQYKLTASTMNQNYESRFVASYFREKIHQADHDSSISVTNLYGTTALTILASTDASHYNTYIYYYDGYLRELLVDENAVFTPDSGRKIIPISGIDLETLSSDLIKATFRGTEDHKITIYLSTKSIHRKETL